MSGEYLQPVLLQKKLHYSLFYNDILFFKNTEKQRKAVPEGMST